MNTDRIASMVKVADRFVEQFIEHSRVHALHTKDFWRNYKLTTAGVNAACLEVLTRRMNKRLFGKL